MIRDKHQLYVMSIYCEKLTFTEIMSAENISLYAKLNGVKQFFYQYASEQFLKHYVGEGGQYWEKKRCV